MKKHTKIYILSALICGILCLNSCLRSKEEEPIGHSGTMIDVTIDLSIVDHKEISSKEKNKYAQITANNVAAAVEIVRNIEQSNYNLNNGTYYKIVSYEKSDDKYIFKESKDLVIGTDNKISLKKWKNYTLIIYSLGTKDVPPELTNRDDFNNAFLSLHSSDENTSYNLLYQRIDNFVPHGENNLSIKLKPKVSNVRFVIDASDFYGGNISGNITELSDIKLSYPKYEEVKLNISDLDEELSYIGKTIKKLDNIKFNNENTKRVSEWKNLFIDTSKNAGNITFSAKITVNGIKEDIPYEINVENIEYGFKQTINLNLELCGLKTNNTGWRQFMCHDLGANYTADPFKGSVYLHGTRYQWAGVKQIPAAEDIAYDVINSWGDVPIKIGDNTEEEAFWGGKNPCPNDYRIPDGDELKELAIRRFRKSGNWSNNGIDSGFELENNEEGKLFFPTTGFRDKLGKLHNKEKETNLWSRREHHMATSVVSVLTIRKDANERVSTDVSLKSKDMGFSVRCIKKNIFDYLNE